MWYRKLYKPALLGFLLLTLFQLTKTLWNTYQAGQQVGLLEQEVEELRHEKQFYEEEVEDRQSDEFVEQEARNKLNLIKPGETVVVIKEPDMAGQGQGEVAAARESIPIPEQWQELILGELCLGWQSECGARSAR